jgi:crotonobetainyl-CoA:carnitine CoA-transferase CaiB-like acyl-CoA transferase
MFALERSPWKIGREEMIVPVAILNHITVIECATFVTGRYATALLADIGAPVIKIEPAPDGDPFPYFVPDPFVTFHCAHLNRTKESLGEHSRKILREWTYDANSSHHLRLRRVAKAPECAC